MRRFEGRRRLRPPSHSRRWQASHITRAWFEGARSVTAAIQPLDPIAAAEADIAGSKSLMAAVADDLSQHERWLAHYRLAEKRHARWVVLQELVYRLEIARRRLMRFLRRVSLLALRLARRTASFAARTAVLVSASIRDAAIACLNWLRPRARRSLCCCGDGLLRLRFGSRQSLALLARFSHARLPPRGRGHACKPRARRRGPRASRWRLPQRCCIGSQGPGNEREPLPAFFGEGWSTARALSRPGPRAPRWRLPQRCCTGSQGPGNERGRLPAFFGDGRSTPRASSRLGRRPPRVPLLSISGSGFQRPRSGPP